MKIYAKYGGQKGYFEVQILRYLQKLNLRVTLKKLLRIMKNP